MLESVAVFSCAQAEGSLSLNLQVSASKKYWSDFYSTSSPLQYFSEWFQKKGLERFESNENYLHSHNRQYFYFRLNNNHELSVIISNRSIISYELFHLFNNLNHFKRHQDDESLSVTIDDMIDNPLRYIARDVLAREMKMQLAETMDLTSQNIQKIVERGERLEDLYEKTIKLDTEALKFREESERLNRCCKWW